MPDIQALVIATARKWREGGKKDLVGTCRQIIVEQGLNPYQNPGREVFRKVLSRLGRAGGKKNGKVHQKKKSAKTQPVSDRLVLSGVWLILAIAQSEDAIQERGGDPDD